MRTHRTPFLFAALLGALALFPACGGDDDGDTPDAAETIDADTTPDSASQFTGLGQQCSDTIPCQDATATECIAMTDTAPTGFCSFECAVTATTAQPTAADNQECIDAFAGTTPDQGTPACALYVDAGQPVMRHWSCGVLCGTYMTTDFGGCPPNLTCTDNVCQ